jgi:hypothetical protein
MAWTKDFNGYDFLLCVWCGQCIPKMIYEKRVARSNCDADVCKDCRDVASYEDKDDRKIKQWIHPVLGWVECIIFEGELNDDWNPIDEDGHLYRPGQRICGLRDCVKQLHILEVQTKSDKKRVRANG